MGSRCSSYSILFFALWLTGCEYFVQKEAAEQKPIARAGENYLYLNDLDDLVPDRMAYDDSVRLVEKLVNDWIKKQIIISKAQSEFNINQDEIDRRVEDYRYALIVHEFEKLYVDSHLQLDVSQEEIETYYSERSDNFLLKQNIIRCLYAKVPRSASSLSQLRRNLRNYPNASRTDIQDYCHQFAVESFLDDSLWVNFNDVIANTPLVNLNNKTQFLRNTTFHETRDDDYIYFLKITDYKITDEISPLEYIYEDIENIIVNKRKIALKKELEDAIYDEAISKKSFEVYRN